MLSRKRKIATASAVVPTRNRSAVLARTLQSLQEQSTLPAELILIDASDDASTEEVAMSHADALRSFGSNVMWHRASQVGAAAQRNEGVQLAAQPFIWFFDDDVLFEPLCFERLWNALSKDDRVGGVNAMIINQHYQAPGRVSRIIYRCMNGGPLSSYAGRVLGPAVNLLPEDRDGLPEIVEVEWLNTTCTLYRRQALPHPPFPPQFVGYSPMEDLALSVTVGKTWKLANARTARIYHNSQLGEDKSDAVVLSRMELINRHYVMTEVLGRRRVRDYAKLFLWEAFQLSVAGVRGPLGRVFWQRLRGKIDALEILIRSKHLGE